MTDQLKEMRKIIEQYRETLVYLANNYPDVYADPEIPAYEYLDAFIDTLENSDKLPSKSVNKDVTDTEQEPKTAEEPLHTLADALIESIMNTSDEDILKEGEKDHGDPQFVTNKMRDIIKGATEEPKTDGVCQNCMGEGIDLIQSGKMVIKEKCTTCNGTGQAPNDSQTDDVDAGEEAWQLADAENGLVCPEDFDLGW